MTPRAQLSPEKLEHARAIGRASYHKHREEILIKEKAKRIANPEREKQKQDRYLKLHRAERNMKKRLVRKANPRKAFETKLCWTYGPDAVVTWHRLLIDQVGLCALCDGQNLNIKRKGLVVDHCHETNQIRGLLCDKCNKSLGGLGDNKAGLQRALDYVS